MEYRASGKDLRRAVSAPTATTPAHLDRLFNAAQQNGFNKATTRQRRAKTATISGRGRKLQSIQSVPA